MSKLSFRARALDASKPMPIYMVEELPDLPDYSAINRAVPQMPSGMEKEEECEHHLQRAICAGLIIPTPEVTEIPARDFYEKVYPSNYKQPRQLIHMQPFTMEQDIPDYDMDSEDERWLQSQANKLDLTPLKFEEMMDKLEKSSGQTVVTLNEAKALLKEEDDLIIAVFDYWLNKRLKTQHPLILTVKTEQRVGTAANNPYLAFRRRTEKMQTRKNRKNDETSYEKMLKLRRDLYRAVTLLELVKKREKIKREMVNLTAEVFEKRYQARDFNGAIYAEASAIKASRPAFTPIFHNHYTNQSWTNKAVIKDEVIPRKEKRQYKKRKHKLLGQNRSGIETGIDGISNLSSEDETMAPSLSPEPEEVEDEGQFAFRRNKLCSYHMPLPEVGNWPWCSKEENGSADKRYRFTLTSLSNPRRCIGFARRRMGRGGRVILDRISTDHDDFWRTLDFSIIEPKSTTKLQQNENYEEIKVDNLDKIANSFINNNNLRTDVKSELNSGFNTSNITRTNLSELTESESVKIEVKKEEDEVLTIGDKVMTIVNEKENSNKVSTKEEEDEMVEFLRSLRRDWLHFRPKTPPPGYEVPCEMLPADNVFLPSANTLFSMEIQPLEAPSTLIDTSTFITDPFQFENFDDIDVPVTDTRQQQLLSSSSSLSTTSSDKFVQTGINLNINVGLNTLNSSVINNNCNNDNNNSNNNNSNKNNNNNNNNNDNGEIFNSPLSDEQIFGGSSCSLPLSSAPASVSSHKSTSATTAVTVATDTLDFIDSSTSSSSLSSLQYDSRIGCSKFFISDLSGTYVKCDDCGVTNNSNSGGGGGCSGGVVIESGNKCGTSNTTNSSTFFSSKLINSCVNPISSSTSLLSSSTSTSSTSSLPTSTSICDDVRSLSTPPNSTNGLLAQFGFDVSSNRTKNNKLYAYTSGVGYSNASTGTLSLHTSAHSLTLNSHSVNILELANDTEKLINSTESVNSGNSGVNNTTTPTVTANNKTKNIVRKNNLVMEVT